MSRTAYPFAILTSNRYIFISEGEKRIKKIVDFVKMKLEDTFNLAFGDLQRDGGIDDTANSNNGDLVKVLATVVNITKHFTDKNPHINLVFYGNTNIRMRLYTRILKTYYSTFINDFHLYGSVIRDGGYMIVSFDPNLEQAYQFFLIKRKM